MTTQANTELSLSFVQYVKKDRVAYIMLNRPECLNAMNLQMHRELQQVWDDFEADDDIWLGVLSGAGERAFSVGQDLKELDNRNSSGEKASSLGAEGMPGHPRLTQRFDLSKPLIAKVQGYAIGGGFELALACDVIVAGKSASFALTEAKLGLIAGAGGVFRLMRQLPSKIATGYLMTGRSIAAERAFELGLVNEVCADEALDACTEQWIQDILRCAPLSVRAIKEITGKSAHLSLEDAFAGEYHWEQKRQLSEDATEGPRAFAQKRQPVWQAK